MRLHSSPRASTAPASRWRSSISASADSRRDKPPARFRQRRSLWISCPMAGYNNEVHGTAVAEIVHEMAPSAQLYLICAENEVSLGNAEAYAKTNHIQIISHSAGWFNSSRGDGSGGPGTPDAIAADATANGILWVNSAGNEAQQHWSGNFIDDGTGFNLFAAGDNTNGFMLAGGGTACVFLKWDAWTGPPQDYDLGLYNQTDPSPVATSINDQGSGAPPVEDLCYTNTGATAPFYVAIARFSTRRRLRGSTCSWRGRCRAAAVPGCRREPGRAGRRLRRRLQQARSAGRTRAPEPYSSQGPTIDGRTKPDIAGQDSTSSATYGNFGGCGTSGFSGTSASAPTTAGAAALLWSAHPDWSYSLVEQALQAQAVDLGAAGVDNQFGAGGLHLNSPQLATHLGVLAPSTSTSGAPFSVTVMALDSANAVVSGYAGTVHFTSSDAGATLPGDYTFAPSDNGVHVFANAFTRGQSDRRRSHRPTPPTLRSTPTRPSAWRPPTLRRRQSTSPPLPTAPLCTWGNRGRGLHLHRRNRRLRRQDMRRLGHHWVRNRHEHSRPEGIHRHSDGQRRQFGHAHLPLHGRRRHEADGDDRHSGRRRLLQAGTDGELLLPLRRRGRRLRDRDLRRNDGERSADRHDHRRSALVHGDGDGQRGKCWNSDRHLHR